MGLETVNNSDLRVYYEDLGSGKGRQGRKGVTVPHRSEAKTFLRVAKVSAEVPDHEPKYVYHSLRK